MGLVDDIRQVNKEPGIFVITPTFDAAQLERDYLTFTSLPIDDMRMSDDKAIALYGKTNLQMYSILQAIINDRPIREDFTDNGESMEIEDIDTELMERIKNPSPELKKVIDAGYNENDEVTVVIWPFTKYRPYTIDELNEMWAKYNSLSADGAERSDRYSYDYYGVDVKEMYHRNMNILLNIVDRILEPGEDHERFDRSIKESIINNTYDRLTLAKEKLNYLSSAEHGNVLEAYDSKEGLELIEARESFLNDLSDEMPGFTPYLTPTEIEDYFEDEGLSKDATTFLEEYKKALSIGLCEFDGEAYKEHIENLYSQKESETHTISIDEQLISLGWNPNVKPTEKSWKFAHDRIRSYINENYGFKVIDVSDLDPITEGEVISPFQPIYIVLSYTDTAIGRVITRVTDCKYSHACISFSEKLDPMYTYATGGLRFETFKDYVNKFKDSRCKVMVVFALEEQMKRIKSNLEYYISNREKTSYAIDNLFNILFNRKIKDEYSLKQVCSQFVNRLLTFGDIDIFNGKSNNLVTPADFDKVRNPSLYTVYEGFVRNYSPNRIKSRVEGLRANNRGTITKTYTLKEAAEMLSLSHYFDDYYLAKSSDPRAEVVIAEIQSLLDIVPIAEAKSLPLHINAKGIVIDLPVRLEEEYQEIHKTLQVYEKEAKYEQMKPELARLWYLNLVAERKIRVKTSKGKTEDAKKIRDARARIMNDFKKYLALVLKSDGECDFAEYFNASKYNDRKLFVDKETLIYSGRAIANVVKNIMKK